MNSQDPVLLSGSPERFGYSWDMYGDILPEHEQQFLRWTAPLGREAWRDKVILDGGCGIGRNSYWPLRYGASRAVCVDVDERTLKKARENLKSFPQAEVRFQSLYDLAEENVFDITFSIGVIHHLEFPERAVERLVRATKPGGRVLVWLYGRENNGWIVNFANPVREGLFSRLPLRLVHLSSWPVTAGLWMALRLGLQQIEYFRLIRTFSFQHLQAIVFDHMIPKIALYYSRDEAVALLEGAGLEQVEAVWVNQMSWAVSGVKPA